MGGWAKRLGKAAAVTVIAGTVGGAAVIAAEALAARARRYAQPDLRLAMRTTVGETTAPALRLVLLGDSSALGVGVDRVAETVGGRLAELLSTRESGGAGRRGVLPWLQCQRNGAGQEDGENGERGG